MALATPTHHTTETDGEVVHRVKHYSIYIVLGSLKQGPELELACHNYLYGSLAKPDCPHRRPGVGHQGSIY